MREIKFRAWNDKSKEIFDVDVLAINPVMWDSGGTGVSLAYQPHIEIMQYTGLRDSKRTKEYPNGQEIYEGDIVRCYGGAYFNGIYEYDYVVEVRDIRGLNEIIYSENVEILGNKYENPELLEELE